MTASGGSRHHGHDLVPLGARLGDGGWSGWRRQRQSLESGFELRSRTSGKNHVNALGELVEGEPTLARCRPQQLDDALSIGIGDARFGKR